MAARELVVVVLNQTNEELIMDRESLHLEQGEWMTGTPESQPPEEIRAGESGMWRGKPPHLGSGTTGSVKYRIAGYGPRDKLMFSWDVRYVGPSKFGHGSESDEFTIRVMGGSGRQAVAVFVVGTQGESFLSCFPSRNRHLMGLFPEPVKL